MELTTYSLIQYFIIYSFFGWIMETTFRSICEKKIINTGFLYGPVCPIYGFGTLIMLIFLERFSENILVLFIASFLILTFWEYIVGVLLEKIFNTKYWDYSNHKVNFQGRICLTNSIMWGFLGVGFIKFAHPFVQDFINSINPEIMHYIIYVSLLLILIDTAYTIIKIKNIKGTLEKIEDINIEIKEKLKEIRKEKKNKEDISKIERLQKMVKKLRQKQKRIFIRLYRQVSRLKKAFPTIDSNEFREVLNRKIEIKKLTESKKKEIKDKIEQKKGENND